MMLTTIYLTDDKQVTVAHTAAQVSEKIAIAHRQGEPSIDCIGCMSAACGIKVSSIIYWKEG